MGPFLFQKLPVKYCCSFRHKQSNRY